MAEAVRRPGVMQQAIAEHQMILDALTAGQPQQVRQHLTEHLQSFISNLDQADNPATENAENTEGAEK
jgi:DNA-binding GntR family transcriptional regulator